MPKVGVTEEYAEKKAAAKPEPAQAVKEPKKPAK
jgi:hypothetical protein